MPVYTVHKDTLGENNRSKVIQVHKSSDEQLNSTFRCP